MVPGNDFFSGLRALVDSQLWASLTPGERAVLIPLMRYADAEWIAFPGATRLAKDSGMLVRNVRRAIKALEERGVLVTVFAGGGHQKQTARRKINLSAHGAGDTGDTSGADDTRGANDTPPVAQVTLPPCQSAHLTRGAGDTQTTHRTTQVTTQLTTHSPAAGADDLEGIFKAFPKRVGKAKAIPAIEKALKAIRKRGTPDPAGWLLAKVKGYAQVREGEDAKYTKHPTSWLNGGHYDDEPTPKGKASREFEEPETTLPVWGAPFREPTPEDIRVAHAEEV